MTNGHKRRKRMNTIKKIEDKKALKRARILESALELYLAPTDSEPSVDQITRKANVAKGTFYLYFPDKSKLEEQLVINIANTLIHYAVDKVSTMEEIDAIDKVIRFTDIMIDYMDERKALLKFIQKKLSWGLYKEILNSTEEFAEAKKGIDILLSKFIEEFDSSAFNKQELMHVMLIIIEMVNGVAYNSIINNEPVGIREIKPTLNKCIRGILNQ